MNTWKKYLIGALLACMPLVMVGCGNDDVATTSVVTDTIPPTVPTELTAPSPTATAVTLTWAASTDPANTDGKPGSGVDGYRIFRDNTQVGTSSTASFTDSSVAASKTYSYTVVAFDKAGNTTPNSVALSVTTPAAGTGPVVPNLNITTSGVVKP